MRLADLLKTMDAGGVSLVQLQAYKPTTGKHYACTVGWFRDGSNAWASSTMNGPTQEDALAAAMRSTGLFNEMIDETTVCRVETPRRRRNREDLLA